MVQHKIQSSSGLTLELEQVPKMLGRLVNEWAPLSYVVSFKLETDESILFQKAWGAIERYNVNLVVANILHTRADVVYLVESVDSASAFTSAQQEIHDVQGRYRRVTTIQRNANMSQIEPILVHSVVLSYYAHLGTATPTNNDISTDTEWPPAKMKDMATKYVDMLTYTQKYSDQVPDDQTYAAISDTGASPVSFHAAWRVGLLFASSVAVAFAVGYFARQQPQEFREIVVRK